MYVNVEVLKEIRTALQSANVTTGGPIVDTIWMKNGTETLFDFIDRAIANAYGILFPVTNEGCGACGDGCQGHSCRLEAESPPVSPSIEIGNVFPAPVDLPDVHNIVMLALSDLQKQCAELAAKYVNSEAFIKSTINLKEIAMRYASPVETRSQYITLEKPLYWKYRRYGSEPEKGYTIIGVTSPESSTGSPIAYLGDGEIVGNSVSYICNAHNAAIDQLVNLQPIAFKNDEIYNETTPTILRLVSALKNYVDGCSISVDSSGLARAAIELAEKQLLQLPGFTGFQTFPIEFRSEKSAWYFLDETSIEAGPYNSYSSAKEALTHYIAFLESGSTAAKDDRDAFERAYALALKSISVSERNKDLEDIINAVKPLRDGDGYRGDRPVINTLWKRWRKIGHL